VNAIVIGGFLMSTLVPAAAFAAGSEHMAILEYEAPASGTWGPSPGRTPTFAFGRPAEVRHVTRDGYQVRQEMAVDQAMEHARYVSQQIGRPVAVTIPDPAGGPSRIEYVGTHWGDVGK
jgi:hypothetical protein